MLITSTLLSFRSLLKYNKLRTVTTITNTTDRHVAHLAPSQQEDNAGLRNKSPTSDKDFFFRTEAPCEVRREGKGQGL